MRAAVTYSKILGKSVKPWALAEETGLPAVWNCLFVSLGASLLILILLKKRSPQWAITFFSEELFTELELIK